jgi:hypothetical protein
MYLQRNLASIKVVILIAKRVRKIRLTSSRESPSGVGAPSHHMYLQRNLVSMKEGVAPVGKRVRRIMVTSSRESPRGGSTLSPHVPAV